MYNILHTISGLNMSHLHIHTHTISCILCIALSTSLRLASIFKYMRTQTVSILNCYKTNLLFQLHNHIMLGSRNFFPGGGGVRRITDPPLDPRMYKYRWACTNTFETPPCKIGHRAPSRNHNNSKPLKNPPPPRAPWGKFLIPISILIGQ